MEKLKVLAEAEFQRLYDAKHESYTFHVNITNDNLDKYKYSCFLKNCNGYDNKIIKKLTFDENMFWCAIKNKSVNVIDFKELHSEIISFNALLKIGIFYIKLNVTDDLSPNRWHNLPWENDHTKYNIFIDMKVSPNKK